MDTIKNTLHFWWTVIVRAATESKNILGTNIKKTILVAILMVPACYIWSQLQGNDSALAKFEWWFILIVLELILYVIIFLPCLCWAPLLVIKEKEEYYTNEIEDLKTERDLLLQNVNEKDKKFERIQNVNPHNKLIADTLKNKLEEFTRMRGNIENRDGSIFEPFHRLDRDTDAYINKNIPSFTGYRSKYPIPTTRVRPVKLGEKDYAYLLDHCNNRIETLNSLIKSYTFD